jgi:hypothetical protein
MHLAWCLIESKPIMRDRHSIEIDCCDHSLQIFQKLTRHEICLGLKTAQFDSFELNAAGYNVADLKCFGFDLEFLKSAGYDFSALVSAGFSGAELTAAGFSAEVKVCP